MTYFIYAALILGTICGYRWRLTIKQSQKLIEKLSTFLMFGLLFVIGINYGSNSNIWNNLASIGFKSLIFAVCSMVGSILVVRLLLTIWR
jgi:uncharacterized membrane protein YbjE (DUF340 family)